MTPVLKQKLIDHYACTPLLRAISFEGIIINDYFLLTPLMFVEYCGMLCFKSHLPLHKKRTIQKLVQNFITQEDLSKYL